MAGNREKDDSFVEFETINWIDASRLSSASCALSGWFCGIPQNKSEAFCLWMRELTVCITNFVSLIPEFGKTLWKFDYYLNKKKRISSSSAAVSGNLILKSNRTIPVKIYRTCLFGERLQRRSQATAETELRSSRFGKVRSEWQS